MRAEDALFLCGATGGRTEEVQRPRKAPAHRRASLGSPFPGLRCQAPTQLPANQGTQTNASVRFTLPYTSASQQNAQVVCKHLLIAKLDNYKSPTNECKCLVRTHASSFASRAARAVVGAPSAASRLPVRRGAKARSTQSTEQQRLARARAPAAAAIPFLGGKVGGVEGAAELSAEVRVGAALPGLSARRNGLSGAFDLCQTVLR